MKKLNVKSVIALVVICLAVLAYFYINRDIPVTFDKNAVSYPCTIEVTRESYYGGKLLTYAVYIDNQKAGNIANGDSKKYSLNLQEGTHVIYVKYGPLKSKALKFDIKEANNLKFRCKTKSILGIDIWQSHE